MDSYLNDYEGKEVIDYNDYVEKLKKLKAEDYSNSFDKDEELNEDEKQLDYLMNKRRSELRNRHVDDGKKYPVSKTFYKAREEIEADPLLNIFKKMPKGANLHIHTGACIDIAEFINMLINDIHISQHVYIYLGKNSLILYGTLFYLLEGNVVEGESVEDIYNLKDAISSEKISLNEFINLFIIDSDAEEDVYAWDRFHNCLNRISTILSTRTIYDIYYENVFKTCVKDNIDYMELRLLIRPVLCDDNKNDLLKGIDPNYIVPTSDFKPVEHVERILNIYKKVKSKKQYMEFKLKVIISGSRSYSQSAEITKNHLSMVRDWMQDVKLKDDGEQFVIGYDVVSEEDRGQTTDSFVKTFIEYGKDIPLFLHDGETRWSDNTNLHSAYLLDTKRIGHGLNLYNFPALMEKIINKNIALEVCPISNQLLGYVDDFRVHPINVYLKRGIQCVICSDDPQLFNYTGLAYDFWVLYYALAFDLKGIKKLIKNSYIYSRLTENEKDEKLSIWQEKWDKFVINAINDLNIH